jgi:hypothetical protein
VKRERPTEKRKRWVTAYVSDRLTREYDQEGRGYVARVARETGFTAAQVSAAKDGKRGVGEDFADAIEAFWRMKRGELARTAEAWSKTGEKPTTEDEERYPNRSEARKLAERAGISPQAIADVMSDAAHSGTDFPVPAWMRLFHARQQMLDEYAAHGKLPGRQVDDD